MPKVHQVHKVHPAHRCKRCNHWIWVEESVAHGLGPVCVTHVILELVKARLGGSKNPRHKRR